MFLKNKKGVILIACYLVIVVLLILGSAFLFQSITEKRIAERERASIQTFYLAEAGIEDAIFQFTTASANFQPPPTLDNIPSMSVIYTITPQGGDYIIVDPDGTSVLCRNYEIVSTATHPQYPNMTSVVHQFIRRRLTSAFNFTVFYASDLEMLPGQNMTLSGRVHSNSDIYIGTHAIFRIDSEYLYSAGDIYNKRKDSTQAMNGDVKIKIKGSSSDDLMKKPGESDPLDSDRSDWTDESQTRWNGTVKSSVHGITPLAVPAVGSIQPDDYYAQNAGLKITRKLGGVWEIYAGGSQISIADLPSHTIEESTFKDNREGKDVTVINIDISKLNTSGYFPSNGLLYATREDASSSQPNGIRLTNGSSLNNSLTVVSNDPVYIQGDYNKDEPASGFIKKPASIICDAVNFLSNNWDDSKSDLHVDNRVASNTEINTAFISGNVPTPDGGGNYSGGLENYPRLHEKWSGKTLTIRGSFVELWESAIAQGAWQYGHPQYKAPIRDWKYDTDFTDITQLPPFPVYVVAVEKTAWW